MALLNKLFITPLFLTIALTSCESESSSETDEPNTQEEANVIIDDQFLESITEEDINLDEDSVPLDEVLVQTNVGEITTLATSVETNLLGDPWLNDGNIHFLVAAEEMNDWEGFLLIFNKNDGEGDLVYQNINLQENIYHWIGVNAWGEDNNRGTLRIVPYSGNNETYYWGKSRTYYPWFNTVSGGNTLLVTTTESDPNGK